MTRFVMFFACCLCTAGTFGGAAGAAMTSPDWPTDGAVLPVASVYSDQAGVAVGTPVSGGTAGFGVAFVRGAEYPSWLPDVMRGLVPWWLGGKPGVFVHAARGGRRGSGGNAPAAPRWHGRRASRAMDSVDDYSDAARRIVRRQSSDGRPCSP